MGRKEPQTEPLLVVQNFHFERSPSWEATAESPLYIGYFQNEHGEQWIFTYDYDAERGTLRGGDAGWTKEFQLEGRFFDEVWLRLFTKLILNDAEKMWLRACWAAVSSFREARDNRRREAEAAQ